MFSITSLPTLQDKVFIVTGGNTGIGYTTCLNLAAKGARVYMGARSSTKATQAIAQIKQLHPKADLRILIMDNTSLGSIVGAAKLFKSQEPTLNGLILNAGIMAVPYEVTTDGFEIQMQVNYLAHWLLAYHLLPVLQSTARKEGSGAARIVCVSSHGHREKPFGVTKMLYDDSEIEKFGNYGRYGLSKLGNVLHAQTLHAEYGPGSENSKQGKGEIWCASLHPGFIDTQLNEKNRDNASGTLKWIHPVLNFLRIMRPWDEGCVTSLFVGASPEFTADLSGLYFDEKAKVAKANPAANEDECLKLEKWTREVIQTAATLRGPVCELAALCDSTRLTSEPLSAPDPRGNPALYAADPGNLSKSAHMEKQLDNDTRGWIMCVVSGIGELPDPVATTWRLITLNTKQEEFPNTGQQRVSGCVHELEFWGHENGSNSKLSPHLPTYQQYFGADGAGHSRQKGPKDKKDKKSVNEPTRDSTKRRPSMVEVQNRVLSFVKDTKPNCDSYGPCFGYTDPCGQGCFKYSAVNSRRPTIPSRISSSTSLSPPEIDMWSTGCLQAVPTRTGLPKSHEHSDEPDEEEYESDNEDLEAQHHHHVPENEFLSIGLQTSIAIALHKLPEGFITYATNHANPSLGFSVFMALFVHNITEGFALALPLFLALNSRLRAMFWASLLGGVSQPLGAAIAAAWFKIAGREGHAPGHAVYGTMFAITAGIMTSVALQLFVEGLSMNHNRNLCIAFGFIGMGIMGMSNALTS
ncbi:hypothetical protein EG329_011077 [Mollisiaceae sp. DMI_Dod_QoI]|nr:hypothetical protein EG329_011077 [Helotiales sp. DMI_Dod_QoI]